MSGYILCQNKKAENPYYIENICANIYTIEELCYYLHHNLYLIDQSLMNEKLCIWIQEELGLPKLGALLKARIGKFASESDILYPIFKEINYLTYEELKQLNARLTRLEKEPPLVREKKKGDSLMKNGMYTQAIEVYQRVLKKNEEENNRLELETMLWHNLGCAYSYLFQMESTVDCFRKAYEKSGRREDLKSLLLAYRSIRTPIEFASLLSELSVDQDVLKEVNAELERFARKPEREVYAQQVDEILQKMTGDYHRSTGS